MSSANMEAASAVPFWGETRQINVNIKEGWLISATDDTDALLLCHYLLLCFCLYLDFVHTVSGVQATNTLQSPSNIQSCGISSQVQTLLLFSVRQHTPGDCEPQLTLVHGWIQGCISKYINKYQTSHLLFFDLGYCWRTGAEEEGVKRPKSWSLDAPCWLWKILFSTK